MSRGIKNLWMPAAHELPTDDTQALVCKKSENEVFACKFKDGHFRYDPTGDPIEDVEWWCSFLRAPGYNFEGGWGQLNQNLREAKREDNFIGKHVIIEGVIDNLLATRPDWKK